MRAKAKVSRSNPAALVQLGVSVLCEGTSRAVRHVSNSGVPPPPPPALPLQRWARATPASRSKISGMSRKVFMGAAAGVTKGGKKTNDQQTTSNNQHPTNIEHRTLNIEP